MRELIITTRKMVNGDCTKADVDTAALRFTIHQVHFNYPARLVMYRSEHARNIEYVTGLPIKRQASMLPVEQLAQAQFTTDFGWLDFDDHTRDHYRGQFHVWPHWLPIENVVTEKGTLFCAIEARAGNFKHKINFEIKLLVN
jgi:hypothetical protein